MPGSRSFLLLHGYGNHRPPEHWQHWLTGALTAAGQGVIYPQLPDPEQPVLEVWKGALLEHLSGLAALSSGRGGDERIVLCHSLSCLLWFHSAPEIPEAHRPDRVVLVAPPDSPQIPEPAAGFRLSDTTGIDAAALGASVRPGGDIQIICSDDDPYNPRGADTVYGAPLGVACHILPGGGHISADDGYGPWPAILTWCGDPTSAVQLASRSRP